MQTFITDHDMAISASNLDDKRLGKQRVEALQIFECLVVKETRWKNHPVVKMWKGYEGYLLNVYLYNILSEWEIGRGFNNEKCKAKFILYQNLITRRIRTEYTIPLWITDKFIETHRSNLIRKNPEHYKPLFPNTKEGLEYIWPKGD
jgi:hypothetical protein